MLFRVLTHTTFEKIILAVGTLAAGREEYQMLMLFELR